MSLTEQLDALEVLAKNKQRIDDGGPYTGLVYFDTQSRYSGATTPTAILSLIAAVRAELQAAEARALPAGCVAVCRKCGDPYEYENRDAGAKDTCTGINPITGRDYVSGELATCPIRRAALKENAHAE